MEESVVIACSGLMTKRAKGSRGRCKRGIFVSYFAFKRSERELLMAQGQVENWVICIPGEWSKSSVL